MCLAEMSANGDQDMARLKKSSATGATAGNVDAFEAEFDR
jgi:hypothetical protein